jgi:hypothetical protein
LTEPFDAADVLGSLYDFQRATAEHAFARLYLDTDRTRRFLVADETGLGKTHVAAGIVAKTIEHLQHVHAVRRIDIVYVCSNADIAEQNLRKLLVTRGYQVKPAARLTLLVTYSDLLHPRISAGTKPVTFVAFTPATSFEFGWQTGRAEERAVLFLLLRGHLHLRKADTTALKRILQGSVGTLERFNFYIDGTRERTGEHWEPGIQAAFLANFDSSPIRKKLETLLSAVSHRRLTQAQAQEARQMSADLRRILARASIEALEPDLVILDEFQRFRHLLTADTAAGELADQLFVQPDAHVLLLSATPYKAFTYVEEQKAGGDDHYQDFIKTIEFLGGGTEASEAIRAALSMFRAGALSGNSIAEAKKILEEQLRRLMCRTERPPAGTARVLGGPAIRGDQIEGGDLAAYVALHRLAGALDAPFSIEYWKAAPYFGNFLDGYRVGEKLKAALGNPRRYAELMPLLEGLQHLRRDDIRGFKTVAWGNARLRRLAEGTVEAGWWRLLWIPPSLPYHELSRPFAVAAACNMTKRLIFSSWVAAPTAIASLLSYEAERRIYTEAEHFENTPQARDQVTSRLALKLDGGRAASMSALSLFWPCPTLAQATDPLLAAVETPRELRTLASVSRWAAGRVRPLVGERGTGRTSASSAWYWAAALLADSRGSVGTPLLHADFGALLDAVSGTAEEQSDGSSGGNVLATHVELALRTLRGAEPAVERPADLPEVVALLGLGAPGNIAWRALGRLFEGGDAVSGLGHWRAAATLASGLRSLFNRPEVTLLLGSPESSDDGAYWQVIARYCLDGDLQAVLDEYLHHLVESGGYDPHTDSGLINIADAARRALTIRAARYVARDPASAEPQEISFLSRFALRFGNVQQEQDDVRLPEVRAAFNSPFWPFVLASTSIGQEGVDFHWWCHAIVHWNLPANPVDFEQREGRVDRFKGHAVRRNVATQFRERALVPGTRDPWRALFQAALAARAPDSNDLNPYWGFPGEAQIERYILGYPLSRDGIRWEHLQEALALYRLAFGQPRQEDMVGILARRGLVGDDARLKELLLDLTPPPFTVS